MSQMALITERYEQQDAIFMTENAHSDNDNNNDEDEEECTDERI